MSSHSPASIWPEGERIDAGQPPPVPADYRRLWPSATSHPSDWDSGDFAAMEYLLHKIPVTTNIIGVRIRFSNGSLTAAVDRLEHQGAVERRGHPADCRASIVHLDGVAAVERVLAIGLLRKLGLTAQWLLHDPDKNRALSCNE